MTAGEHASVAQQPSVIALSGELDAGDTTWAVRLTSELEAGAEQIILDLREVTFIDSSVVRELLRAHAAVEPDGWVRIVYTHSVIKRIIDVCGLSDLFPQYLTPAAAGRGNPRQHAPREESL